MNQKSISILTEDVNFDMVKEYTFDYVKLIGEDIRYNNNNNNNLLLCSDHIVQTDMGDIHKHDFYEIQYVVGGKGIEILNGKSFNIAAGNIVLLTPNSEHTYYSVENLSIVNVCFHPSQLQKRQIGFPENVIFYLNEADRLEYELLYYLLNNALSNDSSGQKANLYFDMLLNIMRTFSLEREYSDKKWSKLMIFISNNFAYPKVEEAAHICGFSVGYFSRQFKKEFGMSFLQYIDNLKIEKAKKLLITGDSIEQIALTLGFSHVTRFYRKFKEIVGMTPNEFRKKN